MEIEAKLIKRGDSHYTLHVVGHPLESIPQAVYPWDITKGRLSLKTCQAIERGYDLEELAEKHIKEWEYERLLGGGSATLAHDNFVMGFQKALELMGDKKFTGEDVRKAIRKAQIVKDGDETFDIDQIFGCTEVCTHCMEYGHTETEIIQSLQQTEWDVILDDENLVGSDGCYILRKK